ncbi:GNAT family N-acetyltransferase [Streptomyces sp. NRRL F-2664]|uniref:GNAT family N-acetyltransferase n=1 Tax=Streptomyces sp. NRRL F-2664 TaxID=1463842 RepID=UPI0004C9648A|nr:GNAT family N-acetyltransferase [Streptomyces sp. NRRL F-2664]
MGLDVVPFEGLFVEPAALLLAGAHPPAGEARSALDLSDVDASRRLVAAWQGTGPAVAAVDDGTLVGFMSATLEEGFGHQHSRIRMHQHASVQRGQREVYRRLYASLADRLTAMGGFEHTIAVSAAHSGVITSLFELGFGIDQVKGLRPASPLIATAERVQLREAEAGDMEDLLRLTVELQQFHAGTPNLRPALADLRSIQDGFRTAFIDERRLLLVAEEHGRLTGMMQAGPDPRYRSTATVGMAVVTASARSKGVGTALLSGVLSWAADQGFATCGTEWSSANLVSDAFSRGHGFTPVGYKLTRLIDARVSWAHTHLNYRYRFPKS